MSMSFAGTRWDKVLDAANIRTCVALCPYHEAALGQGRVRGDTWSDTDKTLHLVDGRGRVLGQGRRQARQDLRVQVKLEATKAIRS